MSAGAQINGKMVHRPSRRGSSFARNSLAAEA